MKKIIPIFLSVFLIISMCACSSGGKNVKFTPKLNEPFIVTAKIQYGDQESEAVFRKYSKANWDIEFSSPNTLSGVILSYRDDKVDASYKGLSFSVPKTALPIKSIISTFIEVVDSTADLAEIEATEKDGLMIIEGETQQGKYTLKLDNSGGLTEFSMPNLELKITFTDFHCDSSDMPEPTQIMSEETTQSDAAIQSTDEIPTEEITEAITDSESSQ